MKQLKKTLLSWGKKKAHNPVVTPWREQLFSLQDISQQAAKVLETLHQAGFGAYIIGGGVRDLLAGMTPKDFDIVTDARPEQIKQLFSNSIIIGRRFKLVHVRYGREIVEVATFRGQDKKPWREKKRKNKHGMIVRDNNYGSISEDAWRRDFTVNAIYYNHADKTLVDYAQGMEDMLDRVIRVIGDPETRYREDPVRMLRAVRLASKLGFDIEEEAAECIFDMLHTLGNVSPDRLFIEVVKMFYTGRAEKTYQMMQEYGLFEDLFPQTHASIQQDKQQKTEEFILRGLANTDKRYAMQLPLSSGYLFAVLLWYPLQQVLREQKNTDQSQEVQLMRAMDIVLDRQALRTSFPKRVADMVRDIWVLQYEFQHRARGAAQALIKHERFKAAYDFLLLRAKVGEDIWLAGWWSEFFEAGHDQRVEMMKKAASEANRPVRKGRDRNASDQRKKPGRRRSKKTT